MAGPDRRSVSAVSSDADSAGGEAQARPAEGAYLYGRRSVDYGMQDAHEGTMCERWGLVQHPAMFIASKLVPHTVEEYFP